jgi:cellulose synthase/poly-beta-1,6-N-acetylglucosamine synthase-like glycosyltransferase
MLDYVVYFFRSIHKKGRDKQWELAKKKLRAENPLLSIVVPGKNEGKHLFKLVKSLNEQTYKNFELIIVDDGSDDDTPIIGRNLERLGMIDLFLRNEVRGGKASAANLAVRYTKGKFIVHLDADCSFDSDAIENIVIPFYIDSKVGAVGGNVKVRNYKQSLATKLQAIEYLKTISVGRISTSHIGIYKIISGAFGAFRKEVLEQVGYWDIGPGLDGDITVKIRKSGYKTIFEPSAICLTSAPINFKILAKQRLRWNKSLVRFRLRKHSDVYLPHANFNWLTFFALFENVFYNLVLDILWWIYIVDLILNFHDQLHNVLLMNLTLYVCTGYIQMFIIFLYSERKKEELFLWLFVPFMTIYNGFFLRYVRTRAYLQELFLYKSYDDPWNPVKSSSQAKINGF